MKSYLVSFSYSKTLFTVKEVTHIASFSEYGSPVALVSDGRLIWDSVQGKITNGPTYFAENTKITLCNDKGVGNTVICNSIADAETAVIDLYNNLYAQKESFLRSAAKSLKALKAIRSWPDFPKDAYICPITGKTK